MLEARSDVLAKDVARSTEAVAAEVQTTYGASFDVALHEYYGEATTAPWPPSKLNKPPTTKQIAIAALPVEKRKELAAT